MEEARRFLRYVSPGLVFVTETVLFLALLVPEYTLPAVQASLTSASAASVLLAALIASGGLGYIFSAVYHMFHWWPGLAGMDHSANISHLAERGVIVVTDHEDVEHYAFLRHHAWILTTRLWYPRIAQEGQGIQGAAARVHSLVDLTHSLGTACVAHAAAGGTVALVLMALDTRVVWGGMPLARGVITLLVFIVLTCALVLGAHRMARLSEGVIDGVLDDALAREQRKEGAINLFMSTSLPQPTQGFKLWRSIPLTRWAIGRAVPTAIERSEANDA